jgi:hypothetical protein
MAAVLSHFAVAGPGFFVSRVIKKLPGTLAPGTGFVHRLPRPFRPRMQCIAMHLFSVLNCLQWRQTMNIKRYKNLASSRVKKNYP